MRIEFGTDEAWSEADYTIVTGRVHEDDILLGDVFTELIWRPYLAEPVNGSLIGEPTIRHAVALRVEGIEAYQHALAVLSSGMTGALTLSGPGEERLLEVDWSVRNGAWLLAGDLRANRPQQTGVCVLHRVTSARRKSEPSEPSPSPKIIGMAVGLGEGLGLGCLMVLIVLGVVGVMALLGRR